VFPKRTSGETHLPCHVDRGSLVGKLIDAENTNTGRESVAQSVEHPAFNRMVEGSNPSALIHLGDWSIGDVPLQAAL
jgi:hypothetical protein